MSEEEKPTTPAAETPKEEESTAEFAPVVSLIGYLDIGWMSLVSGNIQSLSAVENSIRFHSLSLFRSLGRCYMLLEGDSKSAASHFRYQQERFLS